MGKKRDRKKIGKIFHKEFVKVFKWDRSLIKVPFYFVGTFLVLLFFIAGLEYICSLRFEGAEFGLLNWSIGLDIIHLTLRFFQGMMFIAVNDIMNGIDTSSREGFRRVLRYGRPLFLWSLLSGVVSYIMRLLLESGPLGFVLGLIGNLSWSAFSFFVVPNIVLENHGVIESGKAFCKSY